MPSAWVEVDHRIEERVGVGLEIDVGEVAVVVVVGARVAHGREREGADDEEVVVVVALEPELGLVRVDDELVVAGAACGDERRVDAGLSQPRVVAISTGNVSAGSRPPFSSLRLDAEDLADLEHVVAGTAVECRDGRVVVDAEVVVAAHAVDGEPTVERGVVVDPLHEARRLVSDEAAAVAAETAVRRVVTGEQCHEGGMVGRLVRASVHVVGTAVAGSVVPYGDWVSMHFVARNRKMSSVLARVSVPGT